jgi:hypothetical protein
MRSTLVHIHSYTNNIDSPAAHLIIDVGRPSSFEPITLTQPERNVDRQASSERQSPALGIIRDRKSRSLAIALEKADDHDLLAVCQQRL